MYQSVIFDCDGVLVDSEVLSNRAIRDNLARRGLDWPLERVMQSFVGGTIEGVAEQARAAGAILETDWMEGLYAEIFTVLEREVEAVPGVEAVLALCASRGVPMAVGSNGPRAKMAITLGRTGLGRYFGDSIVSVEDVARPKPAPDVFLEALARTGTAAGQTAVIEDSRSGMAAARAAGLACFAYLPEGGEAVDGAVAFRDMAELPGLLGIA
ncbi:HAD family hydrolase [Pontivivens ytuae]|uniref:HAD family phosphatase n=1 Tax=Pontivivens ytuae TaxID=2789856 RepID=A0A7S9QC33_9RHOB|nr:HAD family phosphatase [Pontivivens ytuae]QPH53405.1 HAD family phosphatase [Pontivivens ytuae]